MRIHLPLALLGLALLAPTAGRCDIVLLSDFDGNGTQPGNNIFQAPSFSGSTSTLLETTPNVAAVSTTMASSGASSLNAQWQFKSTATNPWLRFTTFNMSNPVIDAAGAVAMRVYLDSDDPLNAALGLRERVYATDPALGSKVTTGSSTGVEFVGVSGAMGNPATSYLHAIAPKQWQDLVFFVSEPGVSALAGDNKVDSTFGKVEFESIGFRSANGSLKPVNLFIDDIRIVTGNDLASVPEPGSLALLATGLLPLLGLRRRK